MPSQARVHPQAHLPASSGAIIDPTFTAPDFDVKAWINAALDSTSHNRKQDHQQTPPTASSASSPRIGASKDTNGDASLDASLDLLQTPALDPILDGKDQAELLSSPKQSSDSSASVSSTQPSAQQRSQNTYLTQHATSHLTKLHLLASQTSAALSSTTQDMVKLLPRLTHELDQLRQETKALQEGIRLVRSDVHSVESTDTVQALDRLKYLDLVKTRMEATHSALREAENWRNLEAEANDIFAKGDFVKAATRLSEAERSLVVYKNTNVEGDRMALLLVLKDQLEQQIMEKVKDALEHKDTAACQTLMSVFGLIGRPEKFQDYYISQRRAPLLEQWKRSTAGDSKDFVNALQIFYKDTSSMLHDEYAWIASIFSDPTATIHSLVHDIFSHIDPTMKTTLQQISRAQDDETSLPILIDVFEATELFGTRMERIVAQPLVGMQRENGPNTANNSRSRSGTLIQDSAHKEGRAFGRSSLRRDSLDIGTRDPHEWAYILYEPFMTYQRDYGKLEESHLRSLLLKKVPAMAMNSSSSRSKESINASSNLVKIMTISIKEAFDLAGGAIGRCMRLTHGMGVPGLLDGLNGFFKEIMDRYTELLIECRQRSGLPLDESLPAPKTTFSPQGRNSSLDIREEDEDSDGSGDDGNDQDQVNSRLFQMGLRLMVLCRQIMVKIEQLDVKTKKALKGVDEFVKMDRWNQENPPSSSEQGLAGRTNLPPHASIALLQQSNLNSFRLSEILDVVKKSATRDDAGDSSPHPDHMATGTDLGLEPKVNHLFLQSHQRAVLLTKLCQRFIFDSIYIPLVRPLVDLPLLPCWTEGMDQQGEDINSTRRIHKSTMGGTRTDVLKFRSGPSEYMGEMLRRLHALSDTFGMYEGDVGLRFGIHVLPYADKPIQDSAQASALVGFEGGSKDDDRGIGEADVAKTSKTAEDDLDEGREPLEAEDDSAVLHRWITSLSRAAMHTMIEKLYDPNLGACSGGVSTPASATPPSSSRNRFESASSSPALGSPAMFQTQHTSKERHFLSRLSETGAKQLEVDLHYFVTEGLDALAIEPTPSIRSLLQALSMGEAGLLRTLQQQQQQREEHQQQQNRVQEDEQAEKEGDASTTAGKDNRATLGEDEAEQPISIYVPGAPALPSVLAAGDDDSETALSAQEEKIFEWVARLKGIAVLNI